MSTKQTARSQSPWQIPPLGDMARGETQAVQNIAKSTESFLYSLVFALVQTMTALSSPTLGKGDMIYKPGEGDTPDTRLPIGNDGQFLGVTAGLPDWQDLPPDTVEQILTAQGVPVDDADTHRLLELLFIELQAIEAAVIALNERLSDLGV